MHQRSLSSGPLGHDWTELVPSAIETDLPTAATLACGTDRWTSSPPRPHHTPVANRATTLDLPRWCRNFARSTCKVRSCVLPTTTASIFLWTSIPAIQPSACIMIPFAWWRGSARQLNTAHNRHRHALPLRAHIYLFMQCAPTSNLHSVSSSPKSKDICPLRQHVDNNAAATIFIAFCGRSRPSSLTWTSAIRKQPAA